MKMPSNLRPATAEDIKVGAKIWYDYNGYDELFCAVVEEVLRPNAQWKAYTAEDGCRYGLEGAMVETQDAETNDLGYKEMLYRWKRLHDEMAELATATPYGRGKTSKDAERYREAMGEFLKLGKLLENYWTGAPAEEGCRYGLEGALVETQASPDAPKTAIENLIKARAKLEANIKADVQRRVADFEAETGLTPSSIDIRVQEIRDFGSVRSKFVVTDVEASVTL